jgi:hypothetical protein
MRYDHTDLFATPRPARDVGSLPQSWHDSTWDLRRGLDVVEEVPGELLPAEWLQADDACADA